MLSLVEEILLLALDDRKGSFLQVPEYSLELATSGAILMDLALQDRIDADLEELVVVSEEPTGDPILDPVLSEIAREKRPLRAWILQLAGYGVESLHGSSRRDHGRSQESGLSEAAAGAVLLVLSAACAGLLMSQDRALAAADVHVPGLGLPAGCGGRPDGRRPQAREAAEPSERAAALDALLLEQGRNEARRRRGEPQLPASGASNCRVGYSRVGRPRRARMRHFRCGRGPRRASTHALDAEACRRQQARGGHRCHGER